VSSHNLSADTPPLFTALNLFAWGDEEELERLGVKKIIRSRYDIRSLTHPPRTREEESRLSSLIGRLSALWASWTDEERSAFYTRFLDLSRQPKHDRGALHLKRAPVPPSMRLPFTPHLYQLQALDFVLSHPRALLAMEMGLGKTLVAVMALEHRIKTNGARGVIIAPKSAHTSWREHLALGSARSVVLSASSAQARITAYERLLKRELDCVVISPQAMVSDHARLKFILLDSPTLLILDEAHGAKSEKSKRGVIFEDLSSIAQQIIALTGTPKPNAVDDFYHIVDRVKKGALGSYNDFATRYTYRMFDAWSSVVGDSYICGALRADRLNDLYTQLKEVLFVRSSADVRASLSLPPRIDHAPRISMDALQRAILPLLREAQAHKELSSPRYLRMLEGEEGELYQIGAEGATLNAQSLGIRIEQLGICPSLFSASFVGRWPDYESPKMKWIADKAVSHHKREGGGCVIFCEYLGGLDAMKRALLRRGIKEERIALYSGATTERERQKVTQGLNGGEIDFLLGQTKALETGANLQKRADFVAHLSTPWAPDMLTQSTARVYRQGQSRPVVVCRPSGSAIEEAKNRALTRKIVSSAGVVGVAFESDQAVLSTSADKRIREEQGRISLKKLAYNYDIIDALIREELCQS
jgi:SNF2 family DNA or RNA helicase